MSGFRTISLFLDVCKRNGIRVVDLRGRMLVLRLWVAPLVKQCLQVFVLVVTGGCVDQSELRQLARLRDALGSSLNPRYMFIQVVGIRDRWLD